MFRRDMWTSASAITDADDCMRRWWFNKVIKLPQEQRKATIFGDVFHAVLERYFKANDRGIDNKGHIIELYPEGWATMKSRWDKTNTAYTIEPTEEAIIKKLVQEAINDGILVREPGRIIEKSISTHIDTIDETKIIIKGFIDLETPSSIIDHKTAKSTTYILSKAKLKESIQMMLYATVKYLDKHQGNIWLTHNNFIKDYDRPRVIQRSVEVSQTDVMDFYSGRIKRLLIEMVKYYKYYPKSKLSKWRDIRPANNSNQSCNYHYGKPCPYIGICVGVCSIDNYLYKFNTSVKELIGNTKKKENKNMATQKPRSLMDTIRGATGGIFKQKQNVPVTETNLMSQDQARTANLDQAASTTNANIFGAKPALDATPPPASTQIPVASMGSLQDKIAAMQKIPTPIEEFSDNTPAAEPIETVIPLDEVADEVFSTEKSISVKPKAPWYTEVGGMPCVACKDNPILGYDSTVTRPCLICEARAAEAGRPVPINYDIQTSADGYLTFTLIEEGNQEAVTMDVAPTPETQTSMEPIEDKISEPQNSIPNIQEVQSKTPSSTMGDTVLLIGCTYIKKTPKECVYASDLLQYILEAISKEVQKPITSIDHFALMAAIDAQTALINAEVRGNTIISEPPAKASAHARMIDALKLQADTVIYPFSV